jgi:hypothetical protein
MSASTGEITAGAGAVILDAEGIHRDTIVATNSALVVDQDILTSNSASGSLNLDKACMYGLTAIVENTTDTDETYKIHLYLTNSDNSVVARNVLGPESEWAGYAYTFICGYTGPTSGITTPTATIAISNLTGGTKHFHAYVRYTKLL